MAASMKLVILVCAAAVAVSAQDFHLDELEGSDIEVQPLEHVIEKRAANRDQSAIYGSNGPNDRLLHYELVDVKKGILQIKKKDITYPKDHGNNGSNITCIKIIDQMRNGKNADFKVSSGGLNQKFAIINFRSKRGEPIKYIVHIYGR